MATTKYEFETEAQKLLRLMINSLYSTREVFLRELISNASDAIDKLRFESLSNPSLLGDDGEFAISIEFDDKLNVLTITDNGIGMSREELIENLGTIAKSGTESFFDQLSSDEKSNANLIGQFGVGFYSAFLVADEISVVSRRAGSNDSFKWVSRGESDFSVEEAEGERGTRIQLQLKDDAKEFADAFRLRQIVRQYSDHVAVPVTMRKLNSEDDDWETVNKATAIWTRPRGEIEDDEYREFYKHISHDFEDPLLWSHNRVEGRLEYISLIYIPKHAPFDLWQQTEHRGLKLYAQRVFIMDDVDAFLPTYFRWVKGVVDISDFPLNMSRETIQESDEVSSIRNALTRRVIELLQKHADEDSESYYQLWSQFGGLMKASYDWEPTFRDTVPKLFRFSSTHDDSNEQRISLDDYVARMKGDQTEIYYMVGESVATMRNHPLLDVFNQNDLEVLLLDDDYDSYVIMNFTEFEEKQFRDISVNREDLPKLPTIEIVGDETDRLVSRMKHALGESIDDVVISERLTSAPSCLVRGVPWISRGVRAAMGSTQQHLHDVKPVLEVNRNHDLVRYLSELDDDERFENLTNILFEQAQIAYGSLEVDAGEYVRRMNNLLTDLLK